MRRTTRQSAAILCALFGLLLLSACGSSSANTPAAESHENHSDTAVESTTTPDKTSDDAKQDGLTDSTDTNVSKIEGSVSSDKPASSPDSDSSTSQAAVKPADTSSNDSSKSTSGNTSANDSTTEKAPDAKEETKKDTAPAVTKPEVTKPAVPEVTKPEAANPEAKPAANASTAESKPTTYVVEIVDFAFSPAKLEIKAGDIVKFINRDKVKHSATSDDNIFDTTLLGQDEEKPVTFDQAGTFTYYCSPHPAMQGTIVVSAK